MRCVVAAMSFLISSSAPTAAGAIAAPTVHLDTASSRVSFSVTHVMLGRVTGTIPIVTGSVSVAADGSPLSVTATLDPKRIDTGNADRDGDLQSGDWFDTANHPDIMFSSAQITRSGDDTFSILGDLTIRGVTHRVAMSCRILATQPGRNGRRYHYMADVHVQRDDYMPGERWANVLVGKTVSITLDVWTSAGPDR